jgi:hypothetical protein
MKPETAEYWHTTFVKLVEAVGVDEARAIVAETERRMGVGGSTRQWTSMLIRVVMERGLKPWDWLGADSHKTVTNRLEDGES